MKDNVNFWTTICAGTLAILGIFTIVLSPVSSTLGASAPMDFEYVYFSEKGTFIPLFGYAGLIVGGILLLICACNGKKLVGYIAIITLIVSAIIILMTRQFFIFSKMESFSAYQYQKLDTFYGELGLGPILGGVAGLVSASMALIVFFVFEEQGKIKKGY